MKIEVSNYLENYLVENEVGRKVPVSENEQVDRLVSHLVNDLGFEKVLAPGSKLNKTYYLLSEDSDAVLIVSEDRYGLKVPSIVAKDFVMNYMRKENGDFECLIRKTGSYKNKRIDLCFVTYGGRFNVKVYRVIKAIEEGKDFKTMKSIDHELNNTALNIAKYLRFADAKQNNANKGKYDSASHTMVAHKSRCVDEDYIYRAERDMNKYLFLLVSCFVTKEISEEEMFWWRANVN